jgi:uncharacterized protein YbjT (DUF2867 family)
VILTPAPPRRGSTGDRLLRALARRGHAVGDAASPSTGAATLFVCPAPDEPAPDLRTWRAAHAQITAPRLLLVTRLGTHPDAMHPRLREGWALEESARGTGLPALVLRLGPVLGPESPLWRRLRSAPPLPSGGAKLLNPVAEADVVETLDRALSGRAEWSGWYEVTGHEVWSLAELADLAREAGPPLPPGSGGWEPPLAELEEHRLAEAGPWLEHFGMSARPLGEQAREWATALAGRSA